MSGKDQEVVEFNLSLGMRKKALNYECNDCFNFFSSLFSSFFETFIMMTNLIFALYVEVHIVDGPFYTSTFLNSIVCI